MSADRIISLIDATLKQYEAQPPYCSGCDTFGDLYGCKAQPDACQNCGGRVVFGMTEQGFRGFVHVSTAQTACSSPSLLA